MLCFTELALCPPFRILYTFDQIKAYYGGWRNPIAAFEKEISGHAWSGATLAAVSGISPRQAYAIHNTFGLLGGSDEDTPQLLTSLKANGFTTV